MSIKKESLIRKLKTARAEWIRVKQEDYTQAKELKLTVLGEVCMKNILEENI